MVRKIVGVLAASLGLVLLAGCGSSTPTVAEVGNDKLTLDQFEQKYAKYNGGWEKSSTASMQEKETFLDLLVKFELKVTEARRRGLDRDSSVQAELAAYRETIASTYAIEKDMIEPALKEMYNRRKMEVRASHILLRVAQDASPEDTAQVYTRAMEIIAKVTPTNFDSLAVAFSEDPSVAQNKGDLGYFTGGRMVPEFEDAAYRIPVGTVGPLPVRTRFGYHIIKVTGKQESKGPVKISHILRRFAPDQSDTVAVKDTVELIMAELRNGMDFATAAQRYSQDPSSNMRGGSIGAYDRTRLPLEIADLLYATPTDSIVGPVRQPYGYHIFRVDGFNGIPPYADVERELRQQYQQTRYAQDYDDYLHKLQTQYNLTYIIPVMDRFTHAFDSTMTPGTEGWADTLSQDMLAKVLYTYAGNEVPVEEVVRQIESSEEFRTQRLTPRNVENMVQRTSNAKLLDEHVRTVPERFPQFAEIMKEYEDGILLYRIEQDEIWGKISPSDSVLRAYYEEHKQKYRWPRRVRFAEIAVRSDSLANALYERARAGEDFATLAEQYTEREQYRETGGEWPLQAYDANDLSAMVVSMVNDSIAPPILFQGKWSIVKGLGRDSARVKSYEEALPEVRSAYQEYASKKREEDWINELKAKYDVVMRPQILEQAFKNKPSES